MQSIVEAVPNFSEGRNPAVIAALVDAVTSVSGVTLLHQTADADHHRTVLTLAGDPDAVADAALTLVDCARRLIDLTKHHGAHPRIGACDVLPFIPLAGATLTDCVALAHWVGSRIWEQFSIPVYFYEAAALTPARSLLENVRRGGFEDPQLAPDLGGPDLHPTAGAVIVGARRFLIAYNINLATSDVAVARSIARRIRTSSGGLPAVKALGLYLPSRDCAQVSMNLTDYEVTSLDTVFAAVNTLAAEAHCGVLGSELIGLIPRGALPASDVKWESFDPGRIIENRLEAIK